MVASGLTRLINEQARRATATPPKNRGRDLAQSRAMGRHESQPTRQSRAD